jgi:hypothetical protein
MKATLIEIVHDAPEPRWYARHPGLRLWARLYRNFGRYKWKVLRGQQIPQNMFSKKQRLIVDLEHAWQVREGDVELRLMEIPNADGPAS